MNTSNFVDIETAELRSNNWLISHPSRFQDPPLDLTKTNVLNLTPIQVSPILFQQQQNIQNIQKQSKSNLSDIQIQTIKSKLNPIIIQSTNNIIPDLLFYFFFSESNVDNLQKKIKYTVNKWSNFNIGDQSLTELIVVMEGIFIEYAKHLDDKHTPPSILFRNIQNQLNILNQFVIKETVPIIINNVEQHVAFLDEFENKATTKTFERPINTNLTGTMIYRSTNDL